MLTRRTFTKTAATCLSAAASAPMVLSRNTSAQPQLLFVATYSAVAGPEGSVGRGQGICVFEMDRVSGVIRQREIAPNSSNPSCLAISPSGTYLYSANETAVFEGANSGSVSAYRIDRPNGHLTLLNTVASGGAGPCYISAHPGGKHMLVANYAGGTVAVAPIRADGGLEQASFVFRDEGKVGPARAASAPPGSFAISGHDRPHAHMIQADPTGRFVLSTDLGLDRITVWKFDAEHGKLVDPAHFQVPPGDGPRHFAFHPNGRWLFSLQEEASTLMVWDYDQSNGRLSPTQTVSSLPKGFAGTDFTSEVVVSKDGRFVYAANRLHDSISFFSVGSGGKLAFAGEEWTRGDYPRSFTIDPSGRYLYCCNQRSDAITTFLVHAETGRLEFTGRYTPVGTPAMVIFPP